MNKRSLEAIAAVAEKWPEWNPLLHFAAVANDETLDPVIRLDAARAAAAYMLPRPKPVEMEPDALVDLERRLIAAKIEETAKAVKSDDTLADRLARAKARRLASEVFEVFDAMTDAATEAATVIDGQAQPVPRHGAASASAGPAPRPTLHEPAAAPAAPAAPAHYKPILPRPDAPPASADWSAPAVTWPQRQAFADADYDPTHGSYKLP